MACRKNHLRLFELPRGGASLKNIAISVTGGATGVQYDGKYLTIGASDNIYQLRIKGSKAKVVGTTTLTGWSAKSYFIVVKGRRQGRQPCRRREPRSASSTIRWAAIRRKPSRSTMPFLQS